MRRPFPRSCEDNLCTFATMPCTNARLAPSRCIVHLVSVVLRVSTLETSSTTRSFAHSRNPITLLSHSTGGHGLVVRRRVRARSDKAAAAEGLGLALPGPVAAQFLQAQPQQAAVR